MDVCLRKSERNVYLVCLGKGDWRWEAGETATKRRNSWHIGRGQIPATEEKLGESEPRPNVCLGSRKWLQAGAVVHHLPPPAAACSLVDVPAGRDVPARPG